MKEVVREALKPRQRRAYINEVKQQSVSDRWGCKLIGIWRSSYRYQPVVDGDSVDVSASGWFVGQPQAYGPRGEAEGLTQPVKKHRNQAKGGSVSLGGNPCRPIV